MSESSKTCNYAKSELIVFKVKYRSNIKSFHIPRNMPMDEMMRFIVESFQEYKIDASKFRLGIFSGNMLVRYLSETKSFLLSNDLLELVLSPEISAKELASLMACICECLLNPERHGEIDNLSERIEETLNYLYCDEFVASFVKNNGVKTLFNLISSINQCAELKSDLKVQLWRQTLSGLSFLISYDELILETERGIDIIDFPFNTNWLDWNEVSDEIIIKVRLPFSMILSYHYFVEDTLAFRNCLLVLLSFLKSCPNRVQLLLDNAIASFLFNVLESTHTRKTLPPLPQATRGKVSRSNSRLGNLAIRPKILSTSQSTTTSLEVANTKGIAGILTAAEQGKKKRRVTELQVLTVCLVHAIYEASVDSLTETLNSLPPYCIASVVAVGSLSNEFVMGRQLARC
ncbi:unnamed protein product [Rodentolepis nana]|uniref:Uncharacterized protein n=1 Tax=Rodentolepis nana TaxID=102285 RepID=A0A0R3T1I9_RODNA|nr:unnamed protein product [Rodentolepis nana]